MTQENSEQFSQSLELVGEIVAAYVSNNSVPVSEVPDFIRVMHSAIVGLASGATYAGAAQPVEREQPTGAQVRKSVQQDGIVSFLDGKIYKTLKRHLTANGFNPQSYRERYGLPTDYPMVAQSYAEHRSALAKAIGLGQPGAMAERSRKGRKTA